MDDEAPDSPTSTTKVDPGSRQPTDAELSRIAREAVHQPADARLDKQLVRMGLLDDPDSPDVQAAVPVMAGAAPDLELERLRDEYERLRMELSRTIVVVRLLIAILAVLGVIVIVLLVR